jgi:hypothetical protein
MHQQIKAENLLNKESGNSGKKIEMEVPAFLIGFFRE